MFVVDIILKRRHNIEKDAYVNIFVQDK